MTRPRVYISGPITQGDRNKNFFQACDAERQLMLRGFAPLNPMRSMIVPHAWEKDFPHSLWIECDLPWVEAADAVLRLPGYSVGADTELTHAEKRGIPIFHSIEQLEEWKEQKESVLCP